MPRPIVALKMNTSAVPSESMYRPTVVSLSMNSVPAFRARTFPPMSVLVAWK